MKTIKDLQKEVEDFVENDGCDYYSPIIVATLLKSLNNFSGIFTNFYNFKRDNKLDQEKIEKEIGKLLFNMICLANNYEIDLENVLNKFMKRLY